MESYIRRDGWAQAIDRISSEAQLRLQIFGSYCVHSLHPNYNIPIPL